MSDEKPMIFRAVEEFQAMATEVVALRAHAARLEGEVERLNREWESINAERYDLKGDLEDAQADARYAESRAARLEERLGVVRGVLKSVEWTAWSAPDGASCCIVCAELEPHHAPDCALLAALGEGEK